MSGDKITNLIFIFYKLNFSRIDSRSFIIRHGVPAMLPTISSFRDGQNWQFFNEQLQYKNNCDA